MNELDAKHPGSGFAAHCLHLEAMACFISVLCVASTVEAQPACLPVDAAVASQARALNDAGMELYRAGKLDEATTRFAEAARLDCQYLQARLNAAATLAKAAKGAPRSELRTPSIRPGLALNPNENARWSERSLPSCWGAFVGSGPTDATRLRRNEAQYSISLPALTKHARV